MRLEILKILKEKACKRQYFSNLEFGYPKTFCVWLMPLYLMYCPFVASYNAIESDNNIPSAKQFQQSWP